MEEKGDLVGENRLEWLGKDWEFKLKRGMNL